MKASKLGVSSTFLTSFMTFPAVDKISFKTNKLVNFSNSVRPWLDESGKKNVFIELLSQLTL